MSNKWFIFGSFGLSTVLAYASGFTVSAVVERQVGLSDTQKISDINEIEQSVVSTSATSSKNRPSLRADTYVKSIVQRSIFDSSKANIEPTTTTSEDGVSQKTDLQLTLLVTIVGIPEDKSIALIKENTSGISRSYSVGFDLLGEAIITKIEKNRVYFKKNNSEELEYIDINGAEPEKQAPKESVTTEESSDSDVQQVSANKYIVDQKVLDEIMSNPEKLYSQVRVTPNKNESGEIDGYRMTGIRRNSLFYKLGIKNGDIVHSVNGQPLTSLSAAMDAYNSLGNSKNFNFDITRRKNKQTFEYDVR